MLATILTPLFYLFLAVVVPLLGVLGLTYINRDSKRLLGNTWGVESEIWLGGLGIAIHELSHLIMSVVFGHQIESFKLLVMPWNIYRQPPEDAGVLGYVNHYWNNDSLYQSLGNAFIGIAPIFGCSFSLIFLTKYLAPGLFTAYRFLADHMMTDLSPSHLMTLIPEALRTITFPGGMTGLICFLVWIVLSINITVGGFDLSPQDLKSTRVAFVEIYIILAAVFFALCYLGMSQWINYYLFKVLIWFTAIGLGSFGWSVISNIVIRISIWLFRS